MNHLEHLAMHEARQRDLLAQANRERMIHYYAHRERAGKGRTLRQMGRLRRWGAAILRSVASRLDSPSDGCIEGRVECC